MRVAMSTLSVKWFARDSPIWKGCRPPRTETAQLRVGYRQASRGARELATGDDGKRRET